MHISSQLEYKGRKYAVEYSDGEPGTDSDVSAVHAYCFYEDKMVVVRNGDSTWSPPGGSVEKGETYEEAAIREVHEESNMQVLHIECIGYQDVDVPEESRKIRQVRMFCIVEPYGEFASDPDGDVTEVQLIDPDDYKQYFDWGEIGDHVMGAAVEMHSSGKF